MSALEREIVAGSRVSAEPRGDWTVEQVEALYALPLNDLLYTAQWVHRQHFDPNTGAGLHAAVDQDRRLPRGLRLLPAGRALPHRASSAQPLLALDEVVAAAQRAKDDGATRFCMGAAWREPEGRASSSRSPRWSAGSRRSGWRPAHARACSTPAQAARLEDAGLDAYNHNLDISEEFYGEIISTRTYQRPARDARARPRGRHQGLLRRDRRHGRDEDDRIGAAAHAGERSTAPRSRCRSTTSCRAGDAARRRPSRSTFEIVRTIAAARILMPRSMVRLSAGRVEHERRARRSASSPAPTRSSPARSC